MANRFVKLVGLCLLSTIVVVGSACSQSGSKESESASASASAPASSAASEETKAPEPTETEKPAITIKMQTHYNNDNEKAPVDAAIAKLKIDYPNVTIQPEGYGADESVMKARIASGDLPDIFEISSANIELALKTNSILQLDDLAVKYGITNILSPAVADTLTYTDGKIWGIPVYGPMYHTMFYNKELFDTNGIKVPTNFDELLEAAKAFNAKGITPITVSGKTGWAIGSLFEMFAQRINPKGWMALQDGSAKAEDFRDAIVKIERAVKEGVFQKGASIADYDPARAPFHAGKAAMIVIGEWEVSEGQQDLGDKLQYMVQFPTGDAGQPYANPGVMPGGTLFDSFAINSKVEDPDYVFEIFSKFYKYYQEAQYQQMQVIWSTIKTDGLTTEKPLAPLVTSYVAAKGSLKPGGNTWLGYSYNQKFDIGFVEELQKLLNGESADDFIANVDKLQASSKP